VPPLKLFFNFWPSCLPDSGAAQRPTSAFGLSNTRLVTTSLLTLISSLLRLSAHHLALAASASQPLKSRTLSLYLSVPVPVLTPSVVTSRPTTASRPSTPLNPSPPAPQIRLRVYKLYLLTYLHIVSPVITTRHAIASLCLDVATALTD